MKSILLLIIALFTSCATTSIRNSDLQKFVIQVDSYGDDSSIIGKTCYLLLADSTINKNDLQYVEFNNLLRKLFTQKGYKIVDSISLANVIILYNYGISDPKTQNYTASIPVWGQTGISSTSTIGNIYFSPYSNNINYNQTTTRTPSYGVTGFNNVQGSYTTYLRFLNLISFDLDYYIKNKSEMRLWQTTIQSSGSSGDLRKIFPYMLIGAQDFVGHSSGEKKEITLFENDQRVIDIKNK
jgi:hypothetical protein